MLVGTTILKMGSTSFYSPEFRRGGLGATFSAELTHENGSASMDLDIEHRDEDGTAWSTVATFGTLTGVGTYDVSATAIKAVLRFKYTFTGTDLTGFHVVMGAPSWRPY